MDISTPALLFPAIAILMLGYANRYIGAAGVIRNFKKDYDTGYVHVDIVRQIKVMRRRITLFKYMILCASLSLLLACTTMFFVYVGMQITAGTTFGLAVVGMIVSLVLALYETILSNESLEIEIRDMLKKEEKKSKS